ncbi:MAG: sulfatase-like hydrolase/transferase, partial [Pedobacter sp.]|nr:sulfatase-like hydrolase/transferase [Pedobacter sp.]
MFGSLFISLGCLCLLATSQVFAGPVKIVGSTSSMVKLSKAEKPNVIIFFCDNLGYGDIEPFGSKVNRTPYLNRMVSEGRKFTSFYVTAGVCTPSRASMMTGCYPQRVGMHLNPRDGYV